MSFHYNGDNIYLFVKGKEILSLKLIMEMSAFQFGVCEAYVTNVVLPGLEKYLYLYVFNMIIRINESKTLQNI